MVSAVRGTISPVPNRGVFPLPAAGRLCSRPACFPRGRPENSGRPLFVTNFPGAGYLPDIRPRFEGFAAVNCSSPARGSRRGSLPVGFDQEQKEIKVQKMTHPGDSRNPMSCSLYRGVFAVCAGLLLVGAFAPGKALGKTGAFGNQPQIVWMLRNT